ncbi:hypothetical protein CW304_30600 [Bacillus sp. UFRGS-B20]|nr:hypothetical protein CW304_30600 [Bacillus sp. UFRGS-B20]
MDQRLLHTVDQAMEIPRKWREYLPKITKSYASSALSRVRTLPLTQNGKIDAKALQHLMSKLLKI